MWDVKTLRYKSLLGHTDNVICLAATPDDKTVTTSWLIFSVDLLLQLKGFCILGN